MSGALRESGAQSSVHAPEPSQMTPQPLKGQLSAFQFQYLVEPRNLYPKRLFVGYCSNLLWTKNEAARKRPETS